MDTEVSPLTITNTHLEVYQNIFLFFGLLIRCVKLTVESDTVDIFHNLIQSMYNNRLYCPPNEFVHFIAYIDINKFSFGAQIFQPYF